MEAQVRVERPNHMMPSTAQRGHPRHHRAGFVNEPVLHSFASALASPGELVCVRDRCMEDDQERRSASLSGRRSARCPDQTSLAPPAKQPTTISTC